MAGPARSASSNLHFKTEHSYDGNQTYLNSTFDQRQEVRRALTSLFQDLHRLEGQALQLTTDIKISFSGEDRVHSYTVCITDDAFVAPAQPSISFQPSVVTPVSSSSLLHSNSTSYLQGRETRPRDVPVDPHPTKRQGQPVTLIDHSDKRQRLSDGDGNQSDTLLSEGLALAKPGESKKLDELSDFLKEWHAQWVDQGGWLFDNINKQNESHTTNAKSIDKQLDGVQNIIGQSINAASASTMTELASISRLFPWLENTLRANIDKVQQRDEKWRNSSAAFHDESRRDREAAEKALELSLEKQAKQLEQQREVLARLAKANNIDVGDLDPEVNHAASLEAQLAAELNREARRDNVGNSRRKRKQTQATNLDGRP
ncbi:hypothetical protein K431DRAFT_233616 [Polychaeton citri CBS 116435]|uniref:Uncharacterized protein n=1 Tax=Polychaeton citri CBS 116435 TaxID=1314669 RepID=A0A9P4Q330_9PEZI|nr:hypothetical protein K431DRAFT_233616 [Polychaeton citri CBS 116435]